MAKREETLRVCRNGHKYFKSSDCPVCPVCESKKPVILDFRHNLSAPAKRALETAGIDTLENLSKWTESNLLKLHGIGPSSIPKLKFAIEEAKLEFQK